MNIFYITDMLKRDLLKIIYKQKVAQILSDKSDLIL